MGGENVDMQQPATTDAKLVELKEKGNKHIEQKEYTLAIASFTAALEQGGSDSSISHILYSNRAAAHVLLGTLEGYSLSLIDADAAIAANPMYAKGYGRRAMALFKLDRPVEAAAAKKEEGKQQQVAGKFELAAAAYSDAISMHDEDQTLYSNRAACYLRLNKAASALADAKKAISLKKDWVRGYQRGVSSLSQLGEFGAARALLLAATAAVPSTQANGDSLAATEKDLDDVQAAGMAVLQRNLGSTLVRCADQKTVSLQDALGNAKKIGLYFSAHWCGPCRQFTPQLAKLYRDMNAREPGSFVVIFCSSDRSPAEFEEYCSEMPWFALPFGAQSIQTLSQGFGVRGIPHLSIINPNARTISNDGRADVSRHGEGSMQVWEHNAQRF
jgi:nucleoredoxin